MVSDQVGAPLFIEINKERKNTWQWNKRRKKKKSKSKQKTTLKNAKWGDLRKENTKPRT
jgi:hypothetical protein